MHSLTLKKSITLITATTISALIFPQIFHGLGFLLNIKNLGALFLPMYLPVLILALMTGPRLGITVGIITPCVSFILFRMPSLNMLPIVLIELITYGFVAGLLSTKKISIYLKIILTQISGLLVQLLLTDSLSIPVPGLILQLITIPLIISFYNKETTNDSI